MQTETRNEVLLVGRLSAAAEERVLPSGDALVQFRVVVDRPEPRKGESARRPTVDAIECAAWAPGVRRSVASWAAGDVVEVEGALRRRFWRAPGAGLGSRYEVEVSRARRVSKAA